MGIVAVQPRGFRAGANLAIRTLDSPLSLYGQAIYASHHMARNTFIFEQFEQRDVHFIVDLNVVPAGRNVVFSAHDGSPEVRTVARSRDSRRRYNMTNRIEQPARTGTLNTPL
jgi:4-hydroxy-3-methylbut-2-en-1-yl diphosphate reductase